MNIKEFCENYNSKSIDKILNDDLYVSYGMKMIKCKAIIEQAYTDINTGEFKMNTPMRNFLFRKAIVESYTSLVFSSDKDNPKLIVDEYDMLNRHRIIDEIIAAIPEAEYSEYLTILNLTSNDYIETLKYSDSLIGILKTAAPLIEKVEPFLQQTE